MSKAESKTTRTRIVLYNSATLIHYPIVVNLFTSILINDHALAITIAPATGVPQRFYFGFAE